MIHTKSESDMTSLAESSPSRSPKRPIYYVQSPSRDSNDGDNKSAASVQATPTCNSPMESPSHPSMGRHSRNSSGSRFSGFLRSSSGRKGSRRRNDKGWPECSVILEDGKYDDGDVGFSRKVQALIALLCFVILFSVFCFIIWGASRPFKTQVTLKSLVVHNLYVGEATDFSGVPTKMMTINTSVKIGIYNPATFFGIHVTSYPVSLAFSKIVVATAQLQKHYQPRKSSSTTSIVVEGDKVPLYGAGSSLLVSSVSNGGQVPFTLEMDIHSRGYVVGKLVRTGHRLRVSCNVTVDYLSSKPIKFNKDSCSYF